MSEWIATFPEGTRVLADAEGWSVGGDGEEAARVTKDLDAALWIGWPNLPGWGLDRSPGFDPEWMYLRLLALGAVEVEGPCPPCEATDEIEDDEDLVLG